VVVLKLFPLYKAGAQYCQFFCELDLAIAGSEGRRRDINRACYFPVIPSSVKSVEVGRVIGPDSYV
jgi:hypothetical protein